MLLILSGCMLVGMFVAAAFGGSPVPTGAAEERSGGALNGPGIQASAGKAWATSGAQAEAPRMTAPALWLEYARDPVSANRRFRDRPIVISGTVRAAGRDFDGRVVVRFGTDDPFETVNAKLATRDDRLLGGLAKGRPLSLGCVGRGALIGAPLLDDCSVL